MLTASCPGSAGTGAAVVAAEYSSRVGEVDPFDPGVRVEAIICCATNDVAKQLLR